MNGCSQMHCGLCCMRRVVRVDGESKVSSRYSDINEAGLGLSLQNSLCGICGGYVGSMGSRLFGGC